MPERPRMEVLVVAVLLTVVAVSPWLPRVKKREPATRVGLASLLPDHVGEWGLLERRDIAGVDGANELVEAPYVHPDGSLIQLTLEYGSDQRRVHELHYPHICHRVRGDVIVLLPQAPLYIDRDLAVPTFPFHWRESGSARSVYCRFWLVAEGTPTVDVPKVKLHQLVNGFLGRSTSAVMVRMDLPLTEVVTDDARLRAMTAQFAVELYRALPSEGRRLLFGDLAAAPRPQAAPKTVLRGGMKAQLFRFFSKTEGT